MKARELIEQVVASWRGRDPSGQILSQPAFFDLDEAGRVEAFEATVQQRALEAALDEDGLSATSRSVLERIRSA